MHATTIVAIAAIGGFPAAASAKPGSLLEPSATTSPAGKVAAAATDPAWSALFDEAHLAALAGAGCRFGAEDVDITQRLLARGFTADQIVDGYAELGRRTPGRIENLERFAVLRFLALSPARFVEEGYLEGGTVTDFYNAQVGGTGLRIAGWVFFGLGVAALVTGGALYGVSETCYSANDNTGALCWSDTMARAVYATFILGGLWVAIGLPMGIAGELKVQGWAPPGLLDVAPASDLQRYRLGSANRGAARAVRVALSPGAMARGAGLVLNVSF